MICEIDQIMFRAVLCLLWAFQINVMVAEQRAAGYIYINNAQRCWLPSIAQQAEYYDGLPPLENM